MHGKVSIVQTFIMKEKTNPLYQGMGFLSPEFNWMSWAFSCLQLRKHYDNVELYTNSTGKEILIDCFKLPYTKVIIIQDEAADFPDGLWAFPKLMTYALQKQSFIHVDGDVFIWEKLKTLEQGNHLIVQNIEETDHYYRAIYTELKEKDFKISGPVQIALDNGQPLKSVNAGIMGGCNPLFFTEYRELARRLINDNLDKLSLIDRAQFNIIFEQHLFYCLATQKNLSIETQLDEPVTDMVYSKLVDFAGVSTNRSYIHLVGTYKKSIETCIQLAKVLRQDYPDYYYSIINTCKKVGINLFFNCYGDQNTSLLSGDFSYNETITIDWRKLYKTEKKRQQKLELLSREVADLDGFIFKANDLISDLWKTKGEGANYLQVPCSLLRAFRRVEYDELDEIMLSLMTTPQTFKGICNSLEYLFEADELKNDYESFLCLIRLKLKNGCVVKLFQIQ
jgi:hypothetical protein